MLKTQAEQLLDVKIEDYEHFISDLAIDKKIVIKKNVAEDNSDTTDEDEHNQWNVYSAMYYRMEQNVAKICLNLIYSVMRMLKMYMKELLTLKNRKYRA